MANESDLEPTTPPEAVDLYVDYKETNCANATVRNAWYRLKPFMEWCELNGIENLNNITGRDAHRFRIWRKKTGDLKPITMRAHQSTLRIFFRWAESERMLTPELAEEILALLDRFHYASIQHLVIEIMWETAIQLGTAVANDGTISIWMSKRST